MDTSQHERLMNYLYVGLDDLYDQRLGSADGLEQSADVWTGRSKP